MPPYVISSTSSITVASLFSIGHGKNTDLALPMSGGSGQFLPESFGPYRTWHIRITGRQSIVDEALIFYAGLLAPHQRSAAALQQLLSDYFDVPAEIEELVEGGIDWMQIPNVVWMERNPLQELGKGTVLGDETMGSALACPIKLGPMSLAKYLEISPHRFGLTNRCTVDTILFK